MKIKTKTVGLLMSIGIEETDAILLQGATVKLTGRQGKLRKGGTWKQVSFKAIIIGMTGEDRVYCVPTKALSR